MDINSKKHRWIKVGLEFIFMIILNACIISFILQGLAEVVPTLQLSVSGGACFKLALAAVGIRRQGIAWEH